MSFTIDASQLPFMSNEQTFTEYPNEIMETFFRSEVSRVRIKKRSDQLQSRPMMVKLIQKFAKQQKYSQATVHLGELTLMLQSGKCSG